MEKQGIHQARRGPCMITSGSENRSFVQEIYLARERANELRAKLEKTLQQKEMQHIKVSVEEARELCVALQNTLQAIHYQALLAEKQI
jgi:hypothetical protein